MNRSGDAETTATASPVPTVPTVLPVDDRLCLALSAASRAMTAAYRPLLAQLGVTYPQFCILSVLWEDGPSPVGSLATRLALDPSTASPLIKRLEAMGLVSRRRDARDDRRVVVALTPSGAAMELDALEVPARVCGAVGLPDDEIADLVAQIKTVTRHLEESTRGLHPPE